MNDDVTIVHCFVIFYLFGHFFNIFLCQVELLVMIELKYKQLHYNKLTSLCHWIALLYNNKIFHKNTFLNLEILFKDIFEKCWHQYSCVVKMNSFSYLSIVQSDLFSLNLFCMDFEQYFDKIENVLENHYFWYLSKQILTSSTFH